MKRDLFDRLELLKPKFSKGQRLISAYILEHYDRAIYMTAAKLGSTVGVSESTVVRFAVELGYDGYPEFQHALQEYVKTKLTSIQRMEVSGSRIGEEDILQNVLSADIDTLRQTRENMSRADFDHAVQLLSEARTIYILGVRSSAGLASFLGFYFNLMLDNVRLIQTASASEMFEQMLRVGKGDVVIGISFPRYSKRTVKAMEYAHRRGASLIALTDSEQSPLATYADAKLIARSDMVSFVDSLVAPLSIINALIAAVASKRRADLSDIFSQLESIWEEYEVYENLG